MSRYIEREAALKVVADIMQDCKVTHKHRALNRNIKQILPADVVEVKQGEILLPLSIEELRHLINDAIFYIRMMENRNRNKAEFGYFSRQELLEKLKNVERYYEMLHMPVCKKEDEGGADDEER